MRKPIKHIDDLAPSVHDVKVLLKIDGVKSPTEYSVSDSTGEAVLLLDQAHDLQRDAFYWALVHDIQVHGNIVHIKASETQPMVVEETAPRAPPVHHARPVMPAAGAQYGRGEVQHGGAEAGYGGPRRGSGGGAGGQGGGYRGQPRGGSYDGGHGRYGGGYGGGGGGGASGGYQAGGYAEGGGYGGYQHGFGAAQQAGAGQVAGDFGTGYANYDGGRGQGHQQGYQGDRQAPDNARCAPHGAQQRGSAMGYGY